VEYRIEELARAAGVAVDTVRFYQGKGLLEPPRRQGRVTWYSERHLERLRRIRELQQRGFSLSVIRRFLEGELEASDEALVAAVTGDGDPGTLSLEDLAARSGIAVPLLRELERAGMLVPLGDGELPRYSASDLEALRAGLTLVEAGVPLARLMELGARHAAAVERTAQEAVELFDTHVRERIQAQGLPPEEAERQLLGNFRQLLEASGTLVRRHFEGAVLRAARQRIERQ
jgi:DNA-binding transcriptional MerR regulator